MSSLKEDNDALKDVDFSSVEFVLFCAEVLAKEDIFYIGEMWI